MIFKILMVRLRNSDPLHKIIMKCHRKFKVFGRVDKIHINLKALAITSKRIYIYKYIYIYNSIGTFTMQNFILLAEGSLQY